MFPNKKEAERNGPMPAGDSAIIVFREIRLTRYIVQSKLTNTKPASTFTKKRRLLFCYEAVLTSFMPPDMVSVFWPIINWL